MRAVPAGRVPGEVRTSSRSGVPSYVEPEVRRWPNPPEDTPSVSFEPEPALHYIRCALSYQNQLLADIKTLLEQLAAAPPAAAAESADKNRQKL